LQFAEQINNIVSMVAKASKDVFGKQCPFITVYHYRLRITMQHLRTRGDNYFLPSVNSIFRNSFLVRCLFQYA